MTIDLTTISTNIIGKTVQKPVSGTLSGHAAGEPFDKLVYQLIKTQLPADTFRQFEFLNSLYAQNPTAITSENRSQLIHPKTLQYLLNRGKSSISAWSPTNQFEEKQDDTADIIVTDNNFIELIDVKTMNTAKSAQAPNIISAAKVANMCRLMIINNEFNVHGMHYFEVQWELAGDNLVCTSSCSKDLFKSDPSKLYINWAAAMQIQFHVKALGQNYTGTKEQWCKDYLTNFVRQAKLRIEKMQENYVRNYESLL